MSIATHPETLSTALPRVSQELTIAGRRFDDVSTPDVQTPLVSFVVICWNYARYVGQAINSIKQQDYPFFECLVIDNGSTDDSASVIKAAIEGDARFRIAQLDHNMGQLGAALWSLERIRGGFVVFVDADDVLYRNYTSSHLQVHFALPRSVAFTSSSVTEVDATGRMLTSHSSHIKTGRKEGVRGLRMLQGAVRLPKVTDEHYEILSAHTETIPRTLSGWHWGPGTANMFRRSMLELVRLGDGSQDYIRTADTHFNSMCHALAGSAVIDIPLSAYRLHGFNYFTRQESLDGLNKGTKEHRESSRANRLASAELLLTHSDAFAWLLGRDYWATFDQCAGAGKKGSRRIFKAQEAREIFGRNIGRLIHSHGQPRVAREVAWRFGYRQGLRIMRLGTGKSLSIKLRARLFLQSLIGPVAGLLVARRRKTRH
jgi:glycosyltransferase involved in cell wall biosynthesis